MRHGNKINHLSRTYGHRKAMLRNMAVSLILNKRINTTLAKAKELRKFVEPVLTRSKADTIHNRRMVFADLQDKEAVKELFGQVAEKIATRPGGYTRIIKTGFRLGDAAEICMMELVDFNELLLADSSSRKAKTTRRSRSSSKKTISSSGSTVSDKTAAGTSMAASVVIDQAIRVEEPTQQGLEEAAPVAEELSFVETESAEISAFTEDVSVVEESPVEGEFAEAADAGTSESTESTEGAKADEEEK